MKYLPLGIIALCLAACSSPQKNGAATNALTLDTTKNKSFKTPVISTYCFMHIEGKDSIRVQFTSVNNHVEGLIDYFPYQKKGHSGIIEGDLKNDTLRAVWSYATGPKSLDKDTMRVDFLLKSPTVLLQKPFKDNAKTGRQQTDQAAGYTWAYQLSNKKHR